MLARGSSRFLWENFFASMFNVSSFYSHCRFVISCYSHKSADVCESACRGKSEKTISASKK